MENGKLKGRMAEWFNKLLKFRCEATNCTYSLIHLFTYSLLFMFCVQLPVFAAKKPKVYTPESNYKYEQNVLRKLEKEKYERSLLPESGYMTKEEYDRKALDIPNADRVIPEYKLP